MNHCWFQREGFQHHESLYFNVCTRASQGASIPRPPRTLCRISIGGTGLTRTSKKVRASACFEHSKVLFDCRIVRRYNLGKFLESRKTLSQSRYHDWFVINNKNTVSRQKFRQRLECLPNGENVDGLGDAERHVDPRGCGTE